jgi:calcium/proton exchanger cax
LTTQQQQKSKGDWMRVANIEDLIFKLRTSSHSEVCPQRLNLVLNRVFGNIAELYFVLTAVARRESVIAQTALTGALISSCLVVFDTCIFFGGIQYERQYYPTRVSA